MKPVTTCIRINLNGRALATDAATLADLLAAEGFSTAKVATALNGEFVSAKSRASTSLSEGDRVEVVSVRQGG